METEWRPIPGLNKYFASRDGRIKGPRGKVLKPTVNKANGYLYVNTPKQGGGQILRTVHSLVAITYLGPTPEGEEVCHRDGIAAHCAVDNLKHGTRGENMMDAVRHGTHVQARKTHCPRGHEYTPENTRLCKRGARPGREPTVFRQCKTCY